MGRTVLKGTPVCGGVAMGVVRYLDVDYDSFIKEYKKTDKDGELARFVLALKNAKADLDEILSEGEKLSSEEEDIIDMHLMLLDDAGFIEAIKRGIKEGLSCPTSIRKAVTDLKNMFAAMDDEYLRDRANDVEDVGNRVLRKLLGMPETKVEGENLVIVAKDVEPALMAGFSEGKVKAVILENGSKTSHSVIIAKAKGFVTLVGVDISKASGSDGCAALVDGKEGSVVISPEKGEEDAFTKKCEEYAELSSTTQDSCFWVSDERTEVCHGTDTHEDKHWEELVTNTCMVDDCQHTVRQFTHVCTDDVDENRTESDRNQKERLKSFAYSEINDKEAHCNHDE